MDEMNIRSAFLKNAIANIIQKVINQKIGCRTEITFNDPIQMTCDDDKAMVHLNVDLEMKKEDLERLLKKLL